MKESDQAIALFFLELDKKLGNDVSEIVELIASKAPIYQGKLRESFYAKKAPDGWEIRSEEPYFLPLMAGRKPGAKRMPYTDLIPWVEAKIGPKNPARVAYAITQKWFKEGRRGDNFLGLAADEPGELNPFPSGPNNIFSEIEDLLGSLGEVRLF